jgi:hypothetical protein
MTILVFIGIGETFIWYYSNNFMYIKIWHQRLKRGGTFRLEGLEIKIPENCAIQSSKTIETSEEAWFIYATSPVNFHWSPSANQYLTIMRVFKKQKITLKNSANLMSIFI